MPDVTILRPSFTTHTAAQIARDLYNLDATARKLPSERDQNFRLTTTSDGKQCILKISGRTELLATLELENAILKHLSLQSPISNLIPKIIPSHNNQPISYATANGQQYPVRLLTHLPGVLLVDSKPHSPQMLFNMGQTVGQMDAALVDFSHPAAQRSLKWDLKQASFIADYTQFIPNEARRTLVNRFLHQFIQQTRPKLDDLRHSVIHNDANDTNVLVQNEAISGIFDFGDALHTATVCNVAIAAAYASLHKRDPLAAVANVVRGYHAAFPLMEDEVSLLFSLLAMRLCVSVTMAAYQLTQSPEDDYLQITAVPAWKTLEKLAQINPTLAEARLRYACVTPAAGSQRQNHPAAKQRFWPCGKSIWGHR